MKELTESNYIDFVCLSQITTPFEKVKLKNSEESARLCRTLFEGNISFLESFFVLMLDRYNQAFCYAKISQGGRFSTVVDPAIIAKYAVTSLCSGVVLCHNHPSGNLSPSQADKDITKKVISGLKLFDICVLDHLIISETAYFSFADEHHL